MKRILGIIAIKNINQIKIISPFRRVVLEIYFWIRKLTPQLMNPKNSKEIRIPLM
jgi:hypothetical protein